MRIAQTQKVRNRLRSDKGLGRNKDLLLQFEGRKQTDQFRPDYVMPDHHRASKRTFGFAPESGMAKIPPISDIGSSLSSSRGSSPSSGT